jgi:hypothetical protein
VAIGAHDQKVAMRLVQKLAQGGFGLAGQDRRLPRSRQRSSSPWRMPDTLSPRAWHDPR